MSNGTTRSRWFHHARFAAGVVTGGLTWDPRSHTKLVKSPIRPYYKFGVVNALHPDQAIGAVRVTFNDGTVVRGQ